MTAPLLDYGGPASLAAALLIGIAFGWFLERGGLGSARKLTGQFYLTDFTVFKVMFTAIVTAMLGVFWLGRTGWLDPAAVYVPETFTRAQLVGGLAFGAGFAVAGLCPGTSCVAAAAGRKDGVLVALGMLAGILVFNEAFVVLGPLASSGARGVWTLPQMLGTSAGVVTAGVVALAMAGFALAERIERRRR